MSKSNTQSAVVSSDLVVLIGQWEAEANMLRDGTHQKRQGLPRRQVLQEECAYRSCIADLKRLIQHNDGTQRGRDAGATNATETRTRPLLK